jgi:hypothetical protein
MALVICFKIWFKSLAIHVDFCAECAEKFFGCFISNVWGKCVEHRLSLSDYRRQLGRGKSLNGELQALLHT